MVNELSYDLNQIKIKYGEAMMHLSSKLFPTILEEEGVLFEILSENFSYSKELCKDIIDNNKIVDFKNYIYSCYEIKKEEKKCVSTPEDKKKKKGYVLYECKCESDIQKFKKYYMEGEEPCMFKGNRLKNYYVFFAVKKDADNIKREDFKIPDRQDLYGSSVLCIQFWKDDSFNTVSIKNRYNQKFSNSDATYSNNLDRIMPGLTKAFEDKYNLCLTKDLKKQFVLPNYVKAKDGRFYKFNYRINKVYYCPNNIIIDDLDVIKYEKERYIVFDYFILDKKDKKITLYDKDLNDSFVDGLSNFKNIKIEKKNDLKKIILDNIIIVLDKHNNIVSYCNPNLKEVGDNFLLRDKTLKAVYLPNVEKIGSNFMLYNCILKVLDLHSLRVAHNNFLPYNEVLDKVNIQNLEKVYDNFLQYNKSLTSLNLPYLCSVGENFMYENSAMINASFPNLYSIEPGFMHSAVNIKNMDLDSLDKSCYDYLNENSRKFVKNPNLKEKILSLFKRNK